MLVEYVKPSLPAKRQEIIEEFREPFFLPEDPSPPSVFITAIKKNSPFEYAQIGVIDFSKYTLPSEATLSKNSGKHFQARYMTKLLTKEQVSAIEKEAKQRYIDIPPKPNMEYDLKNPEKGPEYFAGYRVCIGDYLILKEIENYSDDEELTKAAPPPEEEDVSGKIEKVIYKQQDKKKKR